MSRWCAFAVAELRGGLVPIDGPMPGRGRSTLADVLAAPTPREYDDEIEAAIDARANAAREALWNVPNPARSAVVLRMTGMPWRAVGEVLDLSPQAASYHYRRGVAKVRALVGDAA